MVPQPARSPVLRTVRGEVAEHFLPDAEGSESGALWRIEGPPLGQGYQGESIRDMRWVDIDGHSTPIPDRISASILIADEGVVYLDAYGPDPGVWVDPLPR